MKLFWWNLPEDGHSDLSGVWIDGVPYRLQGEPPAQAPTVTYGHGDYGE
jgi:hypothetical protein